MRTIGEIIDAVQDGKKDFEPDELRLTVSCLAAALAIDLKRIMQLSCAKKENKNPILMNDPKYVAEETFKNRKAMHAVTPLHYLGDSHNPDSEECQRWRRLSLKIFDHVAKQRTKKE